MSKNEVLGFVAVSPDELLKGKGDRMEYKLSDSLCKDEKRPVSLTYVDPVVTLTK